MSDRCFLFCFNCLSEYSLKICFKNIHCQYFFLTIQNPFNAAVLSEVTAYVVKYLNHNIPSGICGFTNFIMPNPTRISLPRVNYNFDAKACVPVLTVMLNKVEKDYSTVDELCDHDELSKFTRDEIKNAVSELNGRKFLLKVDKPYGCVYAVNKLYIANMEFVYGR